MKQKLPEMDYGKFVFDKNTFPAMYRSTFQHDF